MVKKKGTTGKKGGGKAKRPPAEEEFLSFTPSAGFDIRISAQSLKEMMEDFGQPLVISLPNIAVEFEPGCTRKQIIDGYNQALKASIAVKPANGN